MWEEQYREREAPWIWTGKCWLLIPADLNPSRLPPFPNPPGPHLHECKAGTVMPSSMSDAVFPSPPSIPGAENGILRGRDKSQITQGSAKSQVPDSPSHASHGNHLQTMSFPGLCGHR